MRNEPWEMLINFFLFLMIIFCVRAQRFCLVFVVGARCLIIFVFVLDVSGIIGMVFVFILVYVCGACACLLYLMFVLDTYVEFIFWLWHVLFHMFGQYSICDASDFDIYVVCLKFCLSSVLCCPWLNHICVERFVFVCC